MQFNFDMWARNLPLALSFTLVAACSENANQTTPPPAPVNVAPTVQAGDDFSADEKSAVTVTASASDSDGSISTYAWVQTSGTEVELSDSSTASFDFTAPVAKVEETLVFEITVTDNDGETASDSISVTINPVNEIDFKIQGLVWNGAAVGSDVTADYGSDPMTTSTDQDGAYSFDILADEDLGESLLFLTSVSSSDSEIAFANIPVSLNTLMERAGDDNILEPAEDIGINLTPLSTAFYGMMYRANDAVTSDADVEAAMATVIGGDAIALGTAVKIISENNGGVADQSIINSNGYLGLPDGYDDTIAFAIDPVGTQQYVSTLKASDPTGFDGAKDLMLGDENIVIASADPFTTFPTTITMTASNVVVSRAMFNADGSGIYTEGGNEYDMEWTQDSSGEVIMTGPAGVTLRESESFPWKQINGIWSQVRQINSLDQVTLTPIMVLPSGTVYSHLNTITLSYPDNQPDLPNEDASRQFEVTYITDADYQDIDVEALFNGGTETTLLTSYFSDGFNPNLGALTNTGFGPRQFHFNADMLMLERTGTATNGTVTSQFGSDLFSNGTWEAVDSKTLQVTFSSDRFNPSETFEISYGLINSNLSTVAVRREGALEGLHNGTFAIEDTTQRPQTDADVVGYYALPIGLDSGQIFWTETRSDGTAEVVTVFDRDQDGVLEQTDVTYQTAFWALDSDGRVTISEYRFPGTRAPNCDPNVTTCNDSRITAWNIIDRLGNKVFALNELSIYFPVSGQSNVTEEAWYQTTSRAYDYSTTPPLDISALPPG